MKVLLASVFVLLCFAGASQAQNTLPGTHGGVGYGYDIVTELIMAPIFSFTFNQGRTVQYNGQTWKIPDQLYYASEHYSNLMKDVELFSSYEEWISSSIVSWGISFSLKIDKIPLSFSLSRTKDQYKSLMENNTNNAAIATYHQVEFDLGIYMEKDYFNPNFLAMVQSLPKGCSAQGDKFSYQLFIETFGTHLIQHAPMGGMFNLTTIFKQSIYDKETKEWVQWQAQLSIDQELIDLHFSSNKSHTHVSNVFSEVSKTYEESKGGSQSALNAKGFPQWVATLPDEPAFLMKGTTFMFIYELIEDNNIADCLKQATLAYGTGKKW